MKRVSKHFECKETDAFIDYPDLNNQLKWLPSFDPGHRMHKESRFAFAIDIGDGVGRDYSVINIFQFFWM